MEAMARLDREREHVRIVVALGAAGFGRDVELIVGAAELEGAVEKGAVVEELRGELVKAAMELSPLPEAMSFEPSL